MEIQACLQGDHAPTESTCSQELNILPFNRRMYPSPCLSFQVNALLTVVLLIRHLYLLLRKERSWSYKG